MGKKYPIVGYGMGGKKGGGSVRTPQEAPDSLHNTSYAVVMDILSNGEISGFHNNALPLTNVYLDGTPVQNSDGSMNFQNVSLDFRAGTVSQDYVSGLQVSANIISDGRDITFASPWVQAISNPALTAVRLNVRVPQLVRSITSGEKLGDRVGTEVSIAIDISTGGGAYSEVITDTISGKTISGYTRTYRVDLPDNPASTGWTLRVRRLTGDSTSDSLINKTVMQSFVEVTDGKFVYPMTAYAVIRIDAQQFQSIPARGYHLKGRMIRVPSNYNPDTRIYTGVWDGTFKVAWSDNPAWIYYDILLSDLYGLGERISSAMVDRYAIYQIGAYCDQLVSDGQGGLEPRFTCNVYIQGQQDALRVLNDLTSIFRGMAYWAGGQIVTGSDRPSDPVYSYTNANIIDGKVTYTGSDISTLKTVALVSYNDPTDFYRSKVEVVEDREGISRYGVRKTEVTAFGCTSRGQAQRVGLYHLYTSRMETGGASFSVGLDGVIPQPGSLIRLADRNRAGRRMGGRVVSATDSIITLDADHQLAPGNTLTVTLPSGGIQTSTIASVSGRDIAVSPAYDEAPVPQSVWSADATELVTQTLRVVSIRERDGITYDIDTLFHHPDKFSAIDSNVRLDPLPISVIPARVQAAPDNITISEYHTFHQGTTRHNAEIVWDAADGAVNYDVQWRRDESVWIPMIRSGETTRELTGIFSGEYLVRVRAVNALDVPSLWAYSNPTNLDGMIGEPPAVASLSATGEPMAIRLDWAYPAGANIISSVEIRASLTNDFGDSYALTSAAYPDTSYTLYGLGHGVEMWFWARLKDKNGQSGVWHPLDSSAGIYGKSSTDSAEILSYLEEKIGEGELAPGLLQEITNTVSDGIAEDIEDFLDNIVIDDILDNINYDLIGNLTGDITGDMTWFAGDTTEGYVGAVTITSAYNHGDFLQAVKTDALSARMDDSIAAIQVEQEVQASAIDANASQITTLLSRVGGSEGSIAMIEQEQRTHASNINANASQISSLISRVGGAEGNISAIQQTQQTHANDIGTNASQINTLISRVNGVDGSIAAIQIEQETQAGIIDRDIVGDLTGDESADERWYAGDSSEGYIGTVTPTSAANHGDFLQAMQTATLAARLDSNLASIQVQQQVYTDTLNSHASQITTLISRVNGVDGSIATIRQTQQTHANQISATASTVNGLSSRVGTAEADIVEASEAVVSLDNKLSSSWQVKTQVRSDGRVVQAGVALGASINPNGTARSEFIVMADTIAFINKINGALHAPFVFDTVNDTMILNNAIIGNASIGSAKLANWIESDTKGPGGVAVLRLNFRTGEIQLNPSAGASGRMTLNNNVVQVFDSSNTLRVRMGIW